MLVAIDDKCERRYANKSDKKDENGNKITYYCPECHDKVTLRKGKKNIHHFAHTTNTECTLKTSESLTHMLMKDTVKTIIEDQNKLLRSELEWRIGDRIADYYFEMKDKYDNIQKVCVECVHKHTDIEDFREKNKYYYNHKLYVIWVFNLKRFLTKKGAFKDETTINEMMKEAHTMNYGKIYAIDTNMQKMYTIHFDNIEREVEAKTLIDWDEWDGHSDPTWHSYTVGGYTRTLKNKKKPNLKILSTFRIRSFHRKKADNFLPYPRALANPYITPYWK